jgi:hypothetical protein
MKRFRVAIPMLAALVLAVAGCQMGEWTGDAEADADAIAAAVASPSDGMTQEAMDIGGYLFSSSGGSGARASQKSFVFPVGHVRFFSGDLANFVWDEATKTYVRARSNFDVALPDHEIHVESLLVKVRFFTSTDGSGEAYGPLDLEAGFDPNVHSMRYHREISAAATRLSTGTVNVHTAVSDLAFTDIDTAAGTVTLDGTRTRAFDRTFTSGRNVAGTISDTLSNLVLSWDATTGSLSWAGTLAYVLDATLTRANGTQADRHQEGTIVFSGSSTFTVTVNGTTYRYRLADGTRVE